MKNCSWLGFILPLVLGILILGGCSRSSFSIPEPQDVQVHEKFETGNSYSLKGVTTAEFDNSCIVDAYCLYKVKLDTNQEVNVVTNFGNSLTTPCDYARGKEGIAIIEENIPEGEAVEIMALKIDGDDFAICWNDASHYIRSVAK